MPRLKKKSSALLVVLALGAVLIFAVSLRFPGSPLHALATAAGIAIAALLVVLSERNGS